MSKLSTALVLALALPFAQAALAQDTSQPAAQTGAKAAAPATGIKAPDTKAAENGLAMGKSIVGTNYIKDKSGDWDVRCMHTKDGKDPCELYQLLKDGKGNPVSEFSVFPLPNKGPAVAGGTIVTPLLTLLTQGITLQVDKNPAKRYPFSWCDSSGCLARVGFSKADLDDMKKGQSATLQIVSVEDPRQPIELSISLKGFTAGYAEVEKHNAANAPKAGN